MFIPSAAVVFRSYAKSPELVEEVVERALVSARQVARLHDDSKQLIRKVVFVIPSDFDCGETASALRSALKTEKDDVKSRVIVYEFSGHHSCGALNGTLRKIHQEIGVRYVVIASNKAVSYVTTTVLTAALETLFYQGVKVVGIAVDGLQDIVRSGRVQNTFAVWDVDALLALPVSGFDNETGVEEIAPLVRLVRKYGQCIAVLEPSGGALNIRQSADGQARHDEVMTTKIAEQQKEVDRLGSSFEFIRSGIMRGYPKKV